jgi:hypothetical protein
MRRPALTKSQRDLLAAGFAAGASWVFGASLVIWTVVAVAVGSYHLCRWIGGW